MFGDGLRMPDFIASNPPWLVALILVLVLAGAVGVAVAARKVPVHVMLGVLIGLGTLQGFRPLGYTTVFLLVAASMLPGLAFRYRRRYLDHWGLLLLGYAIWASVAAVWSVSLGALIQSALAYLALLTVYTLARATLDEYGSIRVPLLIGAPFLLVQSILVLVFRVSPTLEALYLSSPIAPLLTEPEVSMVAQGLQENIIEYSKAGGLLLNANTASMFLAVAAAVYFLARCFTKSWVFTLTGALAAAGVIATGSKTPFVLLPAMALAIVLIVLAARGRRLLAVGALVAVGVGCLAVSQYATGLIDSLGSSAGYRRALWGLVFESIPYRWFGGFGFGGWAVFVEAHYQELFGTGYAIQQLPPHNFLLQAWANTGVVGFLLEAALALTPILIAAANLWRRAQLPGATRRDLAADALAFFAVCWVPVHGLMDTTTFFGDGHSLALYAVAVAFALQRRASSVERRGGQSTAEFQRGRRVLVPPVSGQSDVGDAG
jgi:O-antigen ligase